MSECGSPARGKDSARLKVVEVPAGPRRPGGIGTLILRFARCRRADSGPLIQGVAYSMHANAKTAREVPSAKAPHEHLSPWPIFIAIGVIGLYYGVLFRGPILGLAILMFLAALYGWLFEDYSHWKKAPAHSEEAELPSDASFARKMLAKPVGWWGVVIFLLTEIMLFGGLFTLYFLSKASASQWPPAGTPDLPVMKTGINTVILVSSGFTMHIGIWFLKRSSRVAFLTLFAATIVLGITFLYNQVTEYLELMGQGLTLASGSYGGPFYLLTGVHGAHVTAGIAGLVGVFSRSLFGQFDAKRHTGIEGVAIYWHFVDVVWIFLYLVIYLRVI